MGPHSRPVEFILRLCLTAAVAEPLGQSAVAVAVRECTFRRESATTGSLAVISPRGR